MMVMKFGVVVSICKQKKVFTLPQKASFSTSLCPAFVGRIYVDLITSERLPGEQKIIIALLAQNNK
jgi:hypothetical protein